MYGKIKLELVDLIWDYFKDARDTRVRLEGDNGKAEGAAKVREKATVTL